MSNAADNRTEALPEAKHAEGSAWRAAESSGIDMSVLEDSLSKSPWERMQANDDALNFAESLQVAMQQRHAKS